MLSADPQQREVSVAFYSAKGQAVTRYRLLRSAARRYPALDPEAVYEADGEPDGIGGIFLSVSGGRARRYVWLRDFEVIEAARET